MAYNLRHISFLDDLDLTEQRVFVRCDFNVPIEMDEVTDLTRLEAAKPTLQHIIGQGAKLIMASHLGRPGGERQEGLSMEPVGAELAEMLDLDIVLPEELYGEHTDKLIEDLRPDQIMLLENLRFDPGEKGNPDQRKTFGKQLADLTDVYVNDAFGAAHRKHASVYTMAQFFEPERRAAGHLMREEVETLGGLLDDPNRPLVAIMGGAKVSDKLGAMQHLVERVDTMLIGGAMAYTFQKAKGTGVGASRVEESRLDDAERIMEAARDHDTDFILPVDHVVAPSLDAAEEEIRTTDDVAIKAGLSGFDIGPNTVELFSEVIRSSRTVFWNGPLGVFEREPYDTGTMEIAQTLALAPPYSVVGGGDSAAAIRRAGVAEQIDHISTGGGAALDLIQGNTLPGVEALRRTHNFE